MFTQDVNAMCINTLFGGGTIPRMHDSMSRLLEAARSATSGLPARQQVQTFADLGARLGASSATLTNWKARGISKPAALAAEKMFGCSATWLLTGEGALSAGGAASVAGQLWPFERIKPEQWATMPDRWKGAIEDAAVAKLRELRGSPPEDVKFSRTAPVDEDAAALVAALQGVPKTAERVGLYARLLNLVDELKATQIARQRRALDPEPTEEPDQTTDMPTGKTRAPL